MKNLYVEYLKDHGGFKSQATPGRYGRSLERMSKWLKVKKLVSPDFDIWSLKIDLSRIDKELASHQEWLDINDQNHGEYRATWRKYLEFKKFYESRSRSLQIDDKSTIDTAAIASFSSGILKSGLVSSQQLISRTIASLLAKRFLIFTGLSGSGKTKLAQAFSMWICESKDQYALVPVGADWTNREPLLGYRNALDDKRYVKPETGVLDLIIRAERDEKRPYFLILDEMNLSHVERYFADFLSTMESREGILLHSSEKALDNIPSKLYIPDNLFIIGTVNIDETTYMFSPKVLDRANVIEFRVSRQEMAEYLGSDKTLDLTKLETRGSSQAKTFLDASRNNEIRANDSEKINSRLLNFFEQLKKVGAEFGYRSASDIHRLAGHLSVLDPELKVNDIIDIAVMQKLLPKLHGSRRKLANVLIELANLCVNEKQSDAPAIKKVLELSDYNVAKEGLEIIHPISFDKIWRMYRNAIDNGYASYAEA